MAGKGVIGERAAVSEIFLFFSALFDGPPPASVTARRINEIFDDLRHAVGLTGARDAIDPRDLAEDYEPLFLIPDPASPLSLYSTQYCADKAGAGEDFVMDVTILAASLQIPWRKQEFVPGRSYPVTPDHVSVEFALLSALVQLDPSADIAGRSARAWVYRLSEELICALWHIERILQGLKRSRRPRAYEELSAIAHSYVKAYRDLAVPTPH